MVAQEGLFGFKALNHVREPRLGAGGGVGVDHSIAGGLVELFHERAILGYALVKILGLDGFANFPHLGAKARLGGTIAGAANCVLPHAFFGAGCIGHVRVLVVRSQLSEVGFHRTEIPWPTIARKKRLAADIGQISESPTIA